MLITIKAFVLNELYAPNPHTNASDVLVRKEINDEVVLTYVWFSPQVLITTLKGWL